MELASTEVKPWLHHRNYSSSLLKGMKTDISSHPLSQQDCFTKTFPQLPLASPQRLKAQARNVAAVKLDLLGSRDSNFLFPEDYSLQPRRISMKSQLSEALPAPTLSTSSRKILQMTDYDQRFETSMQEGHHLPRTLVSLSSLKSVNPEPISEQSSGSSYSQPEAKELYENEPASYSWDSLSPEEISPQISPMSPISPLCPISPSHVTKLSPPSPLQVHKPARYISPRCNPPLDSGITASEKDILTKLHLEGGKSEGRLDRLNLRPRHNLGETSNLREILDQEYTQHEERCPKKIGTQDRQEMSKRPARNGHLIPRPLKLRPKHKFEHITIETKSHIETKPPMFQNAQDSFCWRIKGLTPSQHDGDPLHKCNHHQSRSSIYGTSIPPVSALGTTQGDFLALPNMPPPPIPEKSTKRKNFDTNKHPLRNLFSDSTHKSPDSHASSADKKFRKRFSGAAKHLHRLSFPTAKKEFIPSSLRDSNGPSTPRPDKTKTLALWLRAEVLHRGTRHLQEVITEAKNAVHYKFADEKRRESLKKNIVLVGITDQSPGAWWFL